MIVGITILISNCTPDNSFTKPQAIKKPTYIYTTSWRGDSQALVLVDVDSCQYLGHLGNSSSDFLAHKGNCKYCHRRDSVLILSILKTLLQKK